MSEPCGNCYYEIDQDDHRYTEMDDTTLRCEDCRQACQGCGEWITITDPKKIVSMRCYVTGRRELWHPECAAEEWLIRMIQQVANNTMDRGQADAIWKLDPETIGREPLRVLHGMYSTVPA